MSLILKGIDLPKKGTIKLEIEPNGTVWAEGKDWQSYTESAIQIPRPHGRLKDENELKSKVHDVILEGGVKHGCIDKTVLHECRTILEAESEEKK